MQQADVILGGKTWVAEYDVWGGNGVEVQRVYMPSDPDKFDCFDYFSDRIQDSVMQVCREHERQVRESYAPDRLED